MGTTLLEKNLKTPEEKPFVQPKRNIISVVADYVEKFLAGLGIMTGILLTINMVVAVLFRYALNKPIFWADELSLYLFCWMTFIGTSLAVKRSEMAAVTLLYDRLSPKGKQIVGIFIQLSMLIFAAIVFYYSLKWVTSPSVVNQLSPTIPVKLWVLYSIVPFSMLSITLFNIDHVIRMMRGNAAVTVEVHEL